MKFNFSSNKHLLSIRYGKLDGQVLARYTLEVSAQDEDTRSE